MHALQFYCLQVSLSLCHQASDAELLRRLL
jgi:hypothetical protein